MDIKDRVIKIIAEQAVLEPSDVTMDSTLEDLGIDSLGLVESIFAIEEEFDISSVSSIIAGIEKLVAEQS
jgi:acyl carrier protein